MLLKELVSLVHELETKNFRVIEDLEIKIMKDNEILGDMDNFIIVKNQNNRKLYKEIIITVKK